MNRTITTNHPIFYKVIGNSVLDPRGTAEPDTCHLQMNFFFGRDVNDDETVATAEKRSRAAPTFPDLSRFTVSTLAKRQRENEKG